MTAPDTFELRQLDPQFLQSERSRILNLLRSAVPFADIREVGSTAVDGVIGKQDVDFTVRVDAERFGETREILDGLFARNERQTSNSGLQGYVVPSTLDVAVQLFRAGGPYDVFDAFVHLLIVDADLRSAYNRLKSEWNGRPMQAYRAAKDAFIESALRGADASSRNAPSKDR